jgi:hypothetical protein
MNHSSGLGKCALLAALALGAAAAVSPLWSAEPAAKPKLWMGPPSYDNGKCFRELFEHPEQWKETRATIDVLVYADHRLHTQFTDDELRAWLPQIAQWGLKFELEVGAVKPWGQTADKTFSAEQPKWDRFLRLGGRIDSIAMDEPLCCCREHIHMPDDHALRETAAFIALVRKHYPQVEICEIETYPNISLADHIQWIEALEKRLAESGVRGLDSYRLDVNWAVFTAHGQGSWREVRKLEQYCRSRKLPFGLFYWASDCGPMKRRGLWDDSTWYVSTMQQAYDYALVDGAPDYYVVQSWLDAPSHSVPETDPWTFTRSVLDFSRKFVKRKP